MLFSNHYLEKLLPQENEWKVEVEHVFKKVKELWDSERSGLPSLNESQLRRHFLDKVFDILGFTTDVEPPVIGEGWAKKPDYAFFKNNDTFKSAKLSPDGYFEKSLCIGEAKKWGRPLDRKLSTEVDPFEGQNPSLQMSRYLWLTGVKWGILTDGKFWRLYEREDSKRLDSYYEIDLEDLILKGTPEAFKYFYLFFRADAFPAFLDKVYKGSVDYAKEVGDELKENVYSALKYVSEGFLKTDTNNLSPENLKEIHDNSLVLLYRLLFVLYAEYRNLLPLGENALYTESYSLHALKKEIAEKLDNNENIPVSTFHYWNKLKELFEIINHGNKELCVPPYNGGLFDPEKHPFLEKYRLGDFYIAMAINLISRSSDKAFVDYGSLEIRHLGSIYEGLLEYKLEITEKDIYPFKEKGREIYIPLSEAQKQGRKIREEEIIRAGELFLVTDKGERRATGSYYTPDYIVKYIVENTIGPVVEDRKKKIAEKITEIKEKIKTSRGYNREANKKELAKAESGLIQEILSIKILDPAMGSGHFLVEAVDFLAHELNRAMSGEPLEKAEISEVKEEVTDYNQKESDEEDVRWARRAVVEKCIFGVDLNPLAVELAKLSLWLHTVAKNSPLNFLDHHLRCGNSLIGAEIEDLSVFPELKKKKVEGAPRQIGLFESIFKERVYYLLNAFAQIEGLPSNTVEDIQKKEKLYRYFRQTVLRFQDVADIWTSVYFDCVIDFDRLQQNLKENDDVWEKLRQETWFKKAKDISNKKRFFHWDIEFPEVFFEGNQRKENPGFDCVIGNPPYGIIFDAYSKTFFNKNYIAAEYQLESFTLFIERAISLLKWNGFHSYITPTTWLSMHYYENLRSLILSNNRLKQIIFFKEPVFEDATVETCVEIVERNKPGTESILMLGIVANKPESMNIKWVKINQQRIEAFEGKRITEYLTPKSLDLFEKIQKICLPLRDITSLIVGCKPYQTGKGIPPQTKSIVENRIFDADFKKDATYKPYIRGEDFYKYELNPQESRWISYGEWLAEPRPSAPFFAPQKIVIRQTADTIIATIDDKQYLNLNNVHNLILKVENYSLEFVLALLNSELLSFLHTMIVPEFGRVFAEVKIVNLGKLPIPSISFTTIKKEREKVMERFKELYSSRKYNDIIADVEACLPKKSDIVHDLLAYLAEQMIEVNKKKNEEIKGFLKWFEREIGSEIDKLPNKTAIKEYHEHDFNQFLELLKKSSKKMSIDTSDRKIQERLEKHFNDSISILEPLKARIKVTDNLIDEIVYRLYGLTEDEIKIVEGKT